MEDNTLHKFLESLLKDVFIRDQMKILIEQYENDDDIWVCKKLNEIIKKK